MVSHKDFVTTTLTNIHFLKSMVKKNRSIPRVHTLRQKLLRKATNGIIKYTMKNLVK